MKWRWNSPEHRLLANFFADFDPSFEDCTLDSAVSLDVKIVQFRQAGHLEAVTELIDEVAASTTTENDVSTALLGSLGSGYPDGTGYRAWLLAVQARLHEIRENPDAIPADAIPQLSSDYRDQRASWFPDPALQDVVTDAVLDVHEEQGRLWIDDPASSGWKRQHYYADLTELRERIGDFGLTAPYADIDRRRTPDPDRTEPATGAVVVVNMGYHTGEITGLAAYPERSLDVGLRNAYPDLCHWFGGYFFQGDRPTTLEMGAACRSTQDPARSRVREQLSRLSGENDDTMRAIVEACGSYVIPLALRHWVDRTLWRLDAFPWLGPDGQLITD